MRLLEPAQQELDDAIAWYAAQAPGLGNGRGSTMRFAAIDFETANNSSDSACAVGITVVEEDQIIDRIYELIRPPTAEFRFTYVHGLAWRDVHKAPDFGMAWPTILRRLGEVDFLAAHNAPFDRGVLSACCHRYRLHDASWPFICTVRLARQVWGLYPTKLPDVCDHLGIHLNHHHADSDAEACAHRARGVQGWLDTRVARTPIPILDSGCVDRHACDGRDQATQGIAEIDLIGGAEVGEGQHGLTAAAGGEQFAAQAAFE